MIGRCDQREQVAEAIWDGRVQRGEIKGMSWDQAKTLTHMTWSALVESVYGDADAALAVIDAGEIEDGHPLLLNWLDDAERPVTLDTGLRVAMLGGVVLLPFLNGSDAIDGFRIMQRSVERELARREAEPS